MSPHPHWPQSEYSIKPLTSEEGIKGGAKSQLLLNDQKIILNHIKARQ